MKKFPLAHLSVIVVGCMALTGSARAQRGTVAERPVLGPVPPAFWEHYRARKEELDRELPARRARAAATPGCDVVLGGFPVTQSCSFPAARRNSSGLCKSQLLSWARQSGNGLRWVQGGILNDEYAHDTESIWFREENGQRILQNPNNLKGSEDEKLYAHLVMQDDAQLRSSDSRWQNIIYGCLVDPVHEQVIDIAIAEKSSPPNERSKKLYDLLRLVDPYAEQRAAAEAERQRLCLEQFRDRVEKLKVTNPALYEQMQRTGGAWWGGSCSLPSQQVPTASPSTPPSRASKSEHEEMIAALGTIAAFKKYCSDFGGMSDDDFATFQELGRQDGMTAADQPAIEEFAKTLITTSNLPLKEFCRQIPRIVRSQPDNPRSAPLRLPNPTAASPDSGADANRGIVSSNPGMQANLDQYTPLGFQSPSANIYCQIQDSSMPPETPRLYLRCDVRQLGTLPPPKPSDCEWDWGAAFSVPQNDPHSQRMCYSDSVIDERLPVLSYGAMWRAQGFTCKSETTGVTCANRFGRGFRLSRSSQQLF